MPDALEFFQLTGFFFFFFKPVKVLSSPSETAN